MPSIRPLPAPAPAHHSPRDLPDARALGAPPPREDAVHIGEGGPLRPQRAGEALPGTYDARGRYAPTQDEAAQGDATEAETSRGNATEGEDSQDSVSTEGEGSGAVSELTPEEEEMVTELRARDREVRTHEQAHQAAGGGRAGAASYTYQRGPDGQSYAIGGEVPIRMPSAEDPALRAEEARIVRRAALAPAEPSGADRAIASAATQIEIAARAEAAEQARVEAEEAGTEADAARDEVAA